MIAEKTKRVLNDPRLLQHRNAWFRRLDLFYRGGFDGRTFNLLGFPGVPTQTDMFTQPEMWVEESLGLLAEQADRMADPDVFRPLAVEYGLYGVHYVDRIFGADVFLMPDGWNSRYLATPIGSLVRPDLDRNETFALSERAARAFVAADVRLPVFGLPTIASALNIAVNLYGEEALVAMYIDPEPLARDLATINDTLMDLHRRFRAILPPEILQPVVSWERTQPFECGQLCGCSTHLLSSELYESMVAPLDAALLGVYPRGGMIHLCGTHTQHIPAFRRMRTLNALQLHNRAAQDLSVYLDGLDPRQVIYVNTCEEMPYDEAVRLSQGRRVVLVGENAPVCFADDESEMSVHHG